MTLNAYENCHATRRLFNGGAPTSSAIHQTSPKYDAFPHHPRPTIQHPPGDTTYNTADFSHAAPFAAHTTTKFAQPTARSPRPHAHRRACQQRPLPATMTPREQI
jgi:hypothetical protein